MLNHTHRRAFVVPFVASVCLFGVSDTWAQYAEDLPPPTLEPWLAEPGDWHERFNDAQIECYEGSMSACDTIGLHENVLMDSWLGKFGETCAGRADLRDMRLGSFTCRTAFPGHE